MEYSPNDISLLEKWLNDEEVQEYYEGRSKTYTREQIVAKFGPRLLGDDPVIPCLILYHGVAIGYMQNYQLLSQEQEDYSVDPDKLAYGIDLFIGEPSYWNKGIGSKYLVEHTGYHLGQIVDRAQRMTGWRYQFVQNGIHEKSLKDQVDRDLKND